MSRWFTGEAAFTALEKAVDDLKSVAPEDHDVLVQAFDISVDKIGYVEPHTLTFSGIDGDGYHTSVVAHFTQLVARVVYLPKKNSERVITGFSRERIKDVAEPDASTTDHSHHAHC